MASAACKTRFYPGLYRKMCFNCTWVLPHRRLNPKLFCPLRHVFCNCHPLHSTNFNRRKPPKRVYSRIACLSSESVNFSAPEVSDFLHRVHLIILMSVECILEHIFCTKHLTNLRKLPPTAPSHPRNMKRLQFGHDGQLTPVLRKSVTPLQETVCPLRPSSSLWKLCGENRNSHLGG